MYDRICEYVEEKERAENAGLYREIHHEELRGKLSYLTLLRLANVRLTVRFYVS